MPPKKGTFSYSIDPELYARSQKPAGTIAMGMKNSQVSSLCWAKQVQKEESIRSRWANKYDPTARQETAALQALERTQTRDAAAHEAYVNPANNPEIHALLYRKKPSTVLVTDDTAAAPPASTLTTAAAAPVEEIASLRVRRAADEYLAARREHYTLQQRYPKGPATAAQAVGWAAATNSGSSSGSASCGAPHRRSPGAYRKPEDEEHATLLGFDYTPK
ncbi:putative mitochondrial hypothetical protein [Leptomonas pyrrhocoris]|uniref:Uncharacterized protein n=1 Tax=Leptomonas pyrrhocoris TaxID=157538 RepID=A0A0M9FSQ6_LEPPY|nr:putative mitochondrial hypothetical protein [Leptomonas pyrrhocoris]KPA75169.1 putative mitochondrial hypothetical protein [Leptomonas pyrrhocoris]|eukprot:XP_015653608.1 putative mitochondrial hypothetical protein [Leptomonas pyrrhocoris]